MGWRTFWVLAASGLATVVASDLALQRVVPLPEPILEVEDGLRSWADTDPDVLVLGSSHVRSFGAIQDSLPHRKLALVTVEWGTFGSYQWVLENRFLPSLASKPRLKDVILVTTFFDLCSSDTVSSRSNLPARAWHLPDFLGAFARDGMTTFNRNYPQRRWNRTFTASLLVQDRGKGRIVAGLRNAVAPRSAEAEQARRQAGIVAMRAELATRHDSCFDAAEREAFEHIVKQLRARGLNVHVVVFPLVPGAVTERFRTMTLARYESWLRAYEARGEIRVVDLSRGAPLADDDFMDDMDHVRPASNVVLAKWLLDGPLAWLKAAP